jgi:PilZ domain
MTAHFDKLKRSAVRRTVHLEGVVRLPDGQIGVCEVHDISKTGAMLVLAVREEMPGQFMLEIPGNTKVLRLCHRVRQQGATVGVRFPDPH